MNYRKKIAELSLHELNHYVAKVEGIYFIEVSADFIMRVTKEHEIFYKTASGRSFPYAPTVDWRQGGPIMETSRISVRRLAAGWAATIDDSSLSTGQTILEAAMRTRVHLAFGPTVEM